MCVYKMKLAKYYSLITKICWSFHLLDPASGVVSLMKKRDNAQEETLPLHLLLLIEKVARKTPAACQQDHWARVVAKLSLRSLWNLMKFNSFTGQEFHPSTAPGLFCSRFSCWISGSWEQHRDLSKGMYIFVRFLLIKEVICVLLLWGQHKCKQWNQKINLQEVGALWWTQ